MRPRHIWSIVGITALLATVALGAAPGAGVGHDDDVIQSPAEAYESDIKATAEHKGWTIEQTRAHFKSDEAVDRIARRVYKERRDIFVGSVMSKEPEGAPSLYIKGPAPEWVLALAADAAVPVRIVDGQPYSRDELHERSVKVLNALLDMGFEQVTSDYFLAGRGTIEAVVLRTPGVTDVRSAILEGLPQGLRSSVDLRFGDKPFDDGDHAQGGARTWSTLGPGICTSGFSVEHLTNGKTGVVEAGHCGVQDSPDQMNRLHTQDQGPHTMTHQAQHRGTWGDVEWLTTNTTEQPQFRAGPGEVRDVLWREQVADISEDSNFCLYSKGQDQKICGVGVYKVDRQCCCTGSSGNYHHMIIMEEDVAVGGDSGGPWYKNNTAVGVHHGDCSLYPYDGLDAFTPIDYLDEALDIQVMKAE
jgi:streptogrisin C